MGKRSTSKHAASARAAARLRRLLVAVLCGGLVFVLSGLLLGSATTATRLLLASGATVVVYAGLLLAKIRRAKGGRRRAAAVAVPDASFVDGEIGIFGDVESVEDGERGERVELLPAEAEHTHDESMDPTAQAEAEAPAVPALLLEELMQQAMAEELANAAAQEESEEVLAEATPTLAAEQDEAQSPDASVVVPGVVTHDLVPISSLHEARAEAEAQSLQRIRATVRGIGVRTGDDPVAVDVLARVVAAVDRLMVSDSSFERPALSETGPLLAAAGAPQEAAPPPREAMPLPAVPAMRPSDMPVTELSTPGLPAGVAADEAPAAPIITTDTRPIEAVVVDDPELVLPIPAPPKPQPAPRGRRLRRNSVA
jgi:hypothetical protein